MNNRIEIIARRIMGWKLNRWDRWYDFETGTFIYDSEFQPEENLNHAMMIVERLEKFGIDYKVSEDGKVCLNDVCATGETLAQAITNAAFLIAEVSSVPDEWL
jgi:hypothetical protein